MSYKKQIQKCPTVVDWLFCSNLIRFIANNKCDSIFEFKIFS
jgi:hypothetical protein